MSVNKRRKWDPEADRLEALAHLVNAKGEAAIVVAMKGLYSAFGAEWEDRADVKRNARLLSGIYDRLGGWFEVILKGGKLASLIEEVGELLDDVKLHRAVYLYNKSLGRFEIGTEGRIGTQAPHALVALAMLPLLDDGRDCRRRLKRCAYRNCGDLFFVRGKLSGQQFCSPAHGNIERVMRWRKKHEG